MRFRIRIAAPGVGLVADFDEDRDAWYADGWSAQRVADMLADSAETWRVDQIVNGDADALDAEQLATIEATSRFFALMARADRREYVPLEELTEAIREVSNRGNGVILEESFRL